MITYTKDTFNKVAYIMEVLSNNEYRSIQNVLLPFISSKEIQYNIISGNEVAINKIKDDILDNMLLPEGIVPIEEIIKFIASFSEDHRYFSRIPLERLGNLNNAIKILPASRQCQIVNDVIDSYKNIVPYYFSEFWKSICYEAQQIGFIRAFKEYPKLSNDLYYFTNEEVKKNIPFADKLSMYKTMAKEDSNKLLEYLGTLKDEELETNYLEVVAILKENNIPLSYFESTEQTRAFELQLSDKLFLNYILEIIEMYKDSSIDNIEDLALTFLNIKDALFLDSDKKLEEDVSNAFYEILGSRYNNDYNLALTALISQEYTNLCQIIGLYHKDVINNLTNEIKLTFFFLQDHNVVEFDQEFYRTNLQEIIDGYLDNNKYEELQYMLNNIIDSSILENQPDSFFLYLYNSEICQYQSFFAKIWKIFPTNFKQEHFKEAMAFILSDNVKRFHNEAFFSTNYIEDFLATLMPNIEISLDDWHKFITKIGISNAIKYVPDKYLDELFNEFIIEGNIKTTEELDATIKHFKENVILRNKEKLMQSSNPLIASIPLHYVDSNSVTEEMLNASLRHYTKEEQTLKKEIYYKLLKYNSNINKTIDFDFISKPIAENLSFNALLRITNYKNMQRTITKYMSDNFILKLINMFTNYDNWQEFLSCGLMSNNKDSIEGVFILLERLASGDFTRLNSKIIKNAFLLYQNDVNYYSINYLEELENYEDIIYQETLAILKGHGKNIQFAPYSYQPFNELDRLTQVKFAILELVYGFDIESAKHIVLRYGTHLDKMDESKLKPDEKELVATLSSLERIVEAKNLDNYVSEILKEPKIYFEKMKNHLILPSFEDKCIKMYQRLYKEVIYMPSVNGPKIVELTPDISGEYNFFIFVRSEGAYDPNWQEPENFVDYFNRPDISYHGNCKSLISNEMLALPQPKGVTFGYTSTNNCISAPWDIVSSGANQSFSIIHTSKSLPVENLSPKTMINCTRYSHNEFVSDRLIYDKDKNEYKKELPDYVIWIKENNNETEEERSKNPSWVMSLKASRDLKIPIIIINREKVVISEYNKTEQLLHSLQGVSINNSKKLLYDTIMRFLNNKNGLQFSDKLKTQYFTIEQENNLFNTIESIITEKTPDEQLIWYANLVSIINEEMDKCYNSQGRKINKSDKVLLERLRKYQEIIKKLEKDIVQSNKTIKSNKK